MMDRLRMLLSTTWAPSLLVLVAVMMLQDFGTSVSATDMQQCPTTLYDCNSLETTLSGVADIILTPDFLSSGHENYNVDDICRFLKTPWCSKAVLAECKGEVVYASGALESRIQYVCGGNRPARKGAQELQTCVRKFQRHFQHCNDKRERTLQHIGRSSQSIPPSHPWCNMTHEYIVCVYSIMALGCTLGVAEEYMSTVNMSAPVVQAILGYSCSFGHPLDILRTTSTVSAMTSAPERAMDSSAVGPSMRSEASSFHLRVTDKLLTITVGALALVLCDRKCLRTDSLLYWTPWKLGVIFASFVVTVQISAPG